MIRPEYFLVNTSNDGNTATFCVEPLESGFGVTLGNSLRRVMLSSIEGVAITSIVIDGVDHEYSTIKGVKQDVAEIIMHLKRVVVQSESREQHKITLDAQGPITVTAGMLKAPTGVIVANPDAKICDIEKGANISMSLTVSPGVGYVTASSHTSSKIQATATGNVIPIDAIFSPVKLVSYKVENSRVGADTDFDKLFITIQTNGSVAPDIALSHAAKILQDQLKVFVGSVDDVEDAKDQGEKLLPFDSRLLLKVDNLELSVRSHNCLKNENIVYIGDLVSKTEARMLQTPNFGKKSLNEIKDLLTKMGMRFGMDVSSWPPKNVEELARKYEEDGSSVNL